uniref:Secreted mucin n=1 Tax=Caenorhabditis tropicalis TaxID=1561998 RepID=A0A1I7V1I8_9PELO
MRTDVGSIPLMCILSTLTSGVFGYLPTEDLTNSIIPGNGVFPPETIIPTDGDEESSPDEDPDDSESIYRKKPTSFRRRNIAPFGGRVPFSRMTYKAGYGSNRIGFNRNAPPPPQMGGFYGANNQNPYGTVSLGGGASPYPGVPEEYNIRPSAPFSGLIGGSRAGYYGSTVGMRRGGVPMSSRKPKMPTDFPPDYAANDLMSSFNGATNSAIPSLRELATYASRYGPAYLRERFGAHEPSPMERLPYGGGPQVPPPRGGGMPIDFNMNIASNHWNKGPMMSRDVDSYQHDDAVKTNKTTTGSPSTTSTRKPRKARKPAKKAKETGSTTTAKPVKTSTKKAEKVEKKNA